MPTKYSGPGGCSARLEPFGRGGFTVAYSACGPELLEEIRDYKRCLRATPGWTSRLDFGPSGECQLHVFPLDDLPSALFARRRAW